MARRDSLSGQLPILWEAIGAQVAGLTVLWRPAYHARSIGRAIFSEAARRGVAAGALPMRQPADRSARPAAAHRSDEELSRAGRARDRTLHSAAAVPQTGCACASRGPRSTVEITVPRRRRTGTPRSTTLAVVRSAAARGRLACRRVTERDSPSGHGHEGRPPRVRGHAAARECAVRSLGAARSNLASDRAEVGWTRVLVAPHTALDRGRLRIENLGWRSGQRG